MNRRNMKRVRDPKACKGCTSCEITSIPTDNGIEPPYQVFIKVPESGNGMPSIVLRSVSDKSYPADLIKVNGAIANELNGWKIAHAINERPTLEIKPEYNIDSIGNDFIAAYRQIEDVVNLNEEMASESAVTLISTALKKLKVCADYLGINVEG